MRILVIGGTQFVGRNIAASALDAGHEVVLLHRGRTGAELFPAAEHLLADRDGDLSKLSGRSFDATVDVCAYWPRQVRALAQALDGRGGHYVCISSVSAYAEPEAPGGDELTALAALDTDDPDALPMNGETYGGLKVCCERAAVEEYGADAVTVVRPSYVVGPYDPTARFTWWVDRLAQGGRVLCPGPAPAPMQLIDARDQASWVVSLLERGTTGAYHSCWPEPPWSLRDMVETIREVVAPADTELVWVPAEQLLAAGVDGSALPLWSEGTEENALALDPAAARRTGLSPQPIAETVKDTYAWLQTADWRRDGVGLDAETEQRLLAY
ncbi:MAG: NAD-dependent epimerase/dehydratase family protein [Nocardioidaceae bacterium]